MLPLFSDLLLVVKKELIKGIAGAAWRVRGLGMGKGNNRKEEEDEGGGWERRGRLKVRRNMAKRWNRIRRWWSEKASRWMFCSFLSSFFVV